MKKIIFLLISSFSFAQNVSEKEVKPIESLFKAMKSADSLGVKTLFLVLQLCKLLAKTTK
jgi:hypothetical protein